MKGEVMRKALKIIWRTALLAGSAALLLTAFSEPKVERYGSVIGLKMEKAAYYRQLHAAAWRGSCAGSRNAISEITRSTSRRSSRARSISFLTSNTRAAIMPGTWPSWPPTR